MECSDQLAGTNFLMKGHNKPTRAFRKPGWQLQGWRRLVDWWIGGLHFCEFDYGIIVGLLDCKTGSQWSKNRA